MVILNLTKVCDFIEVPSPKLLRKLKYYLFTLAITLSGLFALLSVIFERVSKEK